MRRHLLKRRCCLFCTEKQILNSKNQHKYSIYQQKTKKKIRKITTKLQQIKEPDVTTYKEKYRVLRNRRLTQSVFFYVVKRHTISFLLVCYQRLSSWLVKSLLQRNASALFTSCEIRRIFIVIEMIKEQSNISYLQAIQKFYRVSRKY